MCSPAMEVKPHPMTPERYKHCLDVLGWSPAVMSDRARVDLRQVRRWGSTATVPPGIAGWLESIVQLVEDGPPPPPHREG